MQARAGRRCGTVWYVEGMENLERSIMSRVPLATLILLAGGAFLYVVYLMAK